MMIFISYNVHMIIALLIPSIQSVLSETTTLSSNFYFGFSSNYWGATTQQLYIHAQDASVATFNITSLDNMFEYHGSCSRWNPAIVTIPLVYEVRQSDFSWRQKGLKISSNQKVSVLADSFAAATFSVSLVYPCDAVTGISTYIYNIISFEPLPQDPNTQSQILIVGCHENSQITLVPSQTTSIPEDPSSHSSLITLTAGESHSFELQSMQTLRIASDSDLTSTVITSSKPLTVISGSQCTFIPNDVRACDILMTQVPPTIQWGRTFLISPHKGRFGQGYKMIGDDANGETFVVATCNNTVVSNYMLSTGNSSSVTFFTRGDTFCSIVSSQPIYLVQLGVGGNWENDVLGDPTINNIPPIEQHLNFVQFTAITSGAEESFYSVVIQNDKYFNRQIMLNGVLQTISSWKTIYDSSRNIVGYGYSSEAFTGTHTIAHPNINGKLHVTVYGWSEFGGYSYAAGSSVRSLNIPNDVVITPTHGNMLGGTPVVIKHLNGVTGSSNITCVFGLIRVTGIRVSTNEALCVSPRLPRAGPVKLTVYIDNTKVETKDRIFYSQHYADLAEVDSVGDNLILNIRQTIRLTWDNNSLIPSEDENFKINIVLHEAKVYYDSRVEWINEFPVAMGIDNAGIATFTLPNDRSALPFFDPEANSSSYSIILFQVSVNTSDINNDPYYLALQQLNNDGTVVTPTAKWSHVLFRRGVRATPGRLCNSWMNDDSNHPTSFEGVEPCPCTRQQAELPMSTFALRNTPGKRKLDIFFHGRRSTCYEPKRTISNTRNGIFKLSQECCYNPDGNLLVGGSQAGSVKTQPNNEWENQLTFDLNPFISCCTGSATMELIQQYYQKRPSDDCSNFQPLDPPGRARGDPHLLTLDGYQYTFNGKGEFILIETTDNIFQLQGRMVSLEEPDGRESAGTVFSAIAAKQSDSDTVEIQLGDNNPTLLVNGDTVELDDDQAYNNVTVRIRNGAYAVTFSSGAYIEVNQSNGFLSSVVISLPRTFYNFSTRGLLGVYNGDSSDDLLPMNGHTPLPLNSSIDVIHSDFGITWIIANRSQSLFTYEAEDAFESYYKPEFTPVFQPEFNDPELEDEANAICKGDSMCLFDIAVTGRTEIGMDTFQQQEQIEEIIQTVTTPIICSKPCLNGICVGNDTCSCHVGFVGDQCDRKDKCLYDKSSVPCEDAVAGWVYNSDTETCEFGGCRGRGNIFRSMAECSQTCGGCNQVTSSRQCLVNACEFKKCSAFPQAKCEVDACDSCAAHFISGVREVTDQCNDFNCGDSGNSQIKPSDCLIQPCDVSFCPNYPNAVCLPDYCGGCNAKFYTEFGVDITDECSTCPENRPELKCPYDPCKYQKCTNVPDATCMFDTCGQCKARFFVDDGETEVTEQCEYCSVPGQVFTSCASKCKKTCNNFQDNIICQDLCEPGCVCPDNMVLDEEKNRCVLPENCPCPKCDQLPENCSFVVNNTINGCTCQYCTECPHGQVYQECKKCPETCGQSLNSGFTCSDQCVPGCQCPNNELYDDTNMKCMQANKCPEPDRCTLPSVTGPCKGNIRRYYYNTETSRCESFGYGGCMGNKNNFYSLHDCELACSADPPTCTPSFCVSRRTSICTIPSSDDTRDGCPSYVASTCQACYYSPSPISLTEENSSSCRANCVNDGGEYDSVCLKKWGSCLRNLFTSVLRSVPFKDKTDENFRCFEHNMCS